LFVSECAPNDYRNPSAAREVVEWFQELYKHGYMLGGTAFTWMWNPGPDRQYHIIWNKPHVVEAIRAADKPLVKVPTSWEFEGDKEGEEPEEPVGFDADKCGGELRNKLVIELGVPYNPSFAFPLKAQELGWGEPWASEGRWDWQGHRIAYQAFAPGFLFCQEGDWANIQCWQW